MNTDIPSNLGSYVYKLKEPQEIHQILLRTGSEALEVCRLPPGESLLNWTRPFKTRISNEVNFNILVGS